MIPSSDERHVGTGGLARSVARVIRVALEYGKGAVELFEQHHASELMGNSHRAEGKNMICGLDGLPGEAVRRTDGE